MRVSGQRRILCRVTVKLWVRCSADPWAAFPGRILRPLGFLVVCTGGSHCLCTPGTGGFRPCDLNGSCHIFTDLAPLATTDYLKKDTSLRASLVAQWLRIRLPMQETRVQALVREDPTCCGATKPVRHNY
ncbi:hypothetical protein J1605_000315 [Eschrichtius robustus]|uniref:Secreted protein n=1 Tax=Eschrichtius robustus TaxID=9764 RepID=A0AB34HR15_ESCRO|nr:hypothetical protein J1605_000315 [Eschrichtius robustus]